MPCLTLLVLFFASEIIPGKENQFCNRPKVLRAYGYTAGSIKTLMEHRCYAFN